MTILDKIRLIAYIKTPFWGFYIYGKLEGYYYIRGIFYAGTIPDSPD